MSSRDRDRPGGTTATALPFISVRLSPTVCDDAPRHGAFGIPCGKQRLAPSPTMDRELLNTVREADGTPRRSAMFAPEAKDAVAPDDVFVQRRP